MATRYKGYSYEDKFIKVYFQGEHVTVKPIERRIRLIRMLDDDIVWYEYPCPSYDCKVKEVVKRVFRNIVIVNMQHVNIKRKLEVKEN